MNFKPGKFAYFFFFFFLKKKKKKKNNWHEYAALLVIWLALVLLFGLLSEQFSARGDFRHSGQSHPGPGRGRRRHDFGPDHRRHRPLRRICAWAVRIDPRGGAGGLSPAFCRGLLLCLGIGLAAGTLNGLISVGLGIPSFIVTLGMLEIARGLSYLATNSETKYIGSPVEALAQPIAGGCFPGFLLARSW